jgi:hypothetical protein
VVHVDRNLGDSIEIACFSEDPLNAAQIRATLGSHPDISFVLNIPKNARIDGDAYQLSVRAGFAIGGVGDAMRALNIQDPSSYINQRTAFVERILQQHSRLTSFRRLDDSRYYLERSGLQSVVIFVSDDYDVTAESIREAIERYGEFDAFVTSNPNALQISPEASSAAASTGRLTYRWGDFMSALNQPWG